MSCKYKCEDEQCRCKITYGECQFVEDDNGDICPIYNNYKDYDQYLQSLENSEED